jgi:TolB-like protein/DNA-binding winged helix-turn-helix (wHTH) protein/Tfp pilus assembly protein PilF
MEVKASIVRFGIFELDQRTGELRKNGAKVKLEGQPIKVLDLLLECPGELVTQEEIRTRLWPDGTIVEFEHSIKSAVKRLRQAIDDDAEAPRYVQTLPRRGYRFIAPVETIAAGSSSQAAAAAGISAPGMSRRRFVAGGISGLAIALLIASLLKLNLGGQRERVLPQSLPGPKIDSIAVLPLENLSEDPEQKYFTEGMTDELITTLGNVSALRVISRQSVMHYEGTKKSLPEIAHELNADAIVEGTVERSGSRVRITANLVQGATDRHLWAKSYESELKDVLALQGEVARDIAQQIQAKLTPIEQSRLTRPRPVDPEAYQAFLKGRYFLFQTSGRLTVRKALPYFQEAIAKDPNFAMAYWGLAECYVNFSQEIEMAPMDAFPKARAAVLKSLDIDPELAEAHAALGDINLSFDWNWASAEKEFKQAIEQNPSSAVAHDHYGDFLMTMGRWEESLAERRRADELDPRLPGVNARLWDYYWASRQYDKAIELGRQRVEMEPDNAFSHAVLGWPFIEKGMREAAVSEFEKAVALDPGELRLRADLGRVYAEAGKKAEARKILRDLEEQSTKRYVDAYHVALIYIGLRDKPKAFQWLERAYAERSPWMTFIKQDPWMDPLRSDPRFQNLMRRMNFPP